jgi:hypothetical protein
MDHFDNSKEMGLDPLPIQGTKISPVSTPEVAKSFPGPNNGTRLPCLFIPKLRLPDKEPEKESPSGGH